MILLLPNRTPLLYAMLDDCSAASVSDSASRAYWPVCCMRCLYIAMPIPIACKAAVDTGCMLTKLSVTMMKLRLAIGAGGAEVAEVG